MVRVVLSEETIFGLVEGRSLYLQLEVGSSAKDSMLEQEEARPASFAEVVRRGMMLGKERSSDRSTPKLFVKIPSALVEKGEYDVRRGLYTVAHHYSGLGFRSLTKTR